METFADYILGETDYMRKIEIVYYMRKRTNIFFDNSVLFKTELTRMFVDDMKIDIDRNLLITASLLCNCKKPLDHKDLSRVKSYAKDGAQYLSTLGFSDRFCKVCEEVNRYSGSTPREKEGDILELVDNYGGMLLDRPERRAFPIDEALVLLEYRNFKNKQNMYLEKFKEFVCITEKITV